MSKAVLILALMLSACAGATDERWPSLAMRPGEVQPLVQRPAVTASTVTSAAPASTAARDADARLSSLERDVGSLAARVSAQRGASDRAAAAARGAAPDSATGSAVEVEISRSARLSAQAGDLRDRLDGLAGELARRAAAGEDVAATLTRTGAAIERVEALRTPR